jgi:pheromone shutdown protein TraB
VGAKVVLGDQDIDETLRNLEASMSPRDVQAFFTQPMPDDILKGLTQDGPVGMGPGSFGPWGPLAGGRDTQAWVEKLKDRKVVRKLNSYMRRYAPALEKVRTPTSPGLSTLGHVGFFRKGASAG